MDKYQVYHYYGDFSQDYGALLWAYLSLFIIFCISTVIPIYLQCHEVGGADGGGDSNQNYVQWHLETEILAAKAKLKTKKGKKVKKRSDSTSTEET